MEGEHMALTEDIRPISTQIKYIITIHTALLVINAYAHQRIDVFFSIIPYFSLLVFFCLGPLAVTMLLSTRFTRQAAVVLLGALPAILVYNIVARFTALPMFYYQEPSLSWKIIYEGSYGLILILEVISVWLTFKLLQEIHKKMDSPVNDASKP